MRHARRLGVLTQLRVADADAALAPTRGTSRAFVRIPHLLSDALLFSVLPSGRLQIQLSLSAATGAAGEPLLTFQVGQTELVLLAGDPERMCEELQGDAEGAVSRCP